MSKLRVHDMAGEFGISSEDVLSLLRSMDVPVRTHLSPLTDDQIARVRARWEREKRARAEKPAAPVRRRRGAATTEETPAAPARPSKATKAVKAAAPAEPAPPPPVEEQVRRRRRPAPTAAELAAAADELAKEQAATEAAELAAASAATEAAEAEAADVEAAGASQDAAAWTDPRPAGTASETASAPPVQRPPHSEGYVGAPSLSAPGSPISPERLRPRPAIPGAPRPKPSAPGAFVPPRPIASAAPGATTAPPRREERKGPGTGGPPPSTQSAAQRRKKGKRGAVDQEEVSANIFKTMTALRGPVPTRGRGKRAAEDITAREESDALRQAAIERERKTVRVNEFITVSELAGILKIPATQIVSFAFKNLGLMVTINQRMDFDQIELIAGEFGFNAVREEEYAAAGAEAEPDKAEELRPRPPVVTIMGHVDHGKTSLLDYIRRANVVAGEAGGITQHIGAYHVSLPGGKQITFLDTPGHEAFTAMRARGAQVTDLVVLVVAADDQVMPQTVEAISHAKNAGVPMIVAINKIDLPSANVPKVKQDLLQHSVVLEEFGGTTLCTEISAKKGTNVQQLLDQILLQAEILDLRANPNRRAVGAVVEAQLDPGKGPVATVLVSAGTLRVGDDFICGLYSGRVRALLDERGHTVSEAGPAIPVQVLGIEGVATGGDQFLVVEAAADARDVAQRRQRLDREAKSRRSARSAVTLEDFMAHASAGQQRNLRLVIKADQGGPAEALADALSRLSTEEVKVEIIHRGVGAITESDVLLGRASGAILIGFHVRPDTNARAAAEREGVDIKLYRVIYDAVADVRAAMEGLLRPEQREVILGEAEVREIFKVSKVGVVAGSFVRSGILSRQAKVRLIRDGVEVYTGTLASLRRFKDDVKEVREGFECGLGIENFNDIKVGDVIECFRTEEFARVLSSPSA